LRNPFLDFKQHNDTINANRYCETLQKLHTKIQNKCLGKLTDSIILLYNIACPNVAHRVQDKLNVMQWAVLKHSAYSPDLSPCDFHFAIFFGPLKKTL
jgi:hypothetical protein